MLMIHQTLLVEVTLFKMMTSRHTPLMCLFWDIELVCSCVINIGFKELAAFGSKIHDGAKNELDCSVLGVVEMISHITVILKLLDKV